MLISQQHGFARIVGEPLEHTQHLLIAVNHAARHYFIRQVAPAPNSTGWLNAEQIATQGSNSHSATEAPRTPQRRESHCSPRVSPPGHHLRATREGSRRAKERRARPFARQILDLLVVLGLMTSRCGFERDTASPSRSVSPSSVPHRHRPQGVPDSGMVFATHRVAILLSRRSTILRSAKKFGTETTDDVRASSLTTRRGSHKRTSRPS